MEATMTTDDETRRVVEAFFAAWTNSDAQAARALMADDLAYEGPLNSYQSADALIGPLMKFAAQVRSAKMIDVVVEGDRAALLYDCELPAPVGTFRAASFQRVAGGKITSYLQAFDATELRRAAAPKGT
jgi:ketosteroid isomerase-like protein